MAASLGAFTSLGASTPRKTALEILDQSIAEALAYHSLEAATAARAQLETTTAPLGDRLTATFRADNNMTYGVLDVLPHGDPKTESRSLPAGGPKTESRFFPPGVPKKVSRFFPSGQEKRNRVILQSYLKAVIDAEHPNPKSPVLEPLREKDVAYNALKQKHESAVDTDEFLKTCEWFTNDEHVELSKLATSANGHHRIEDQSSLNAMAPVFYPRGMSFGYESGQSSPCALSFGSEEPDLTFLGDSVDSLVDGAYKAEYSTSYESIQAPSAGFAPFMVANVSEYHGDNYFAQAAQNYTDYRAQGYKPKTEADTTFKYGGAGTWGPSKASLKTFNDRNAQKSMPRMNAYTPGVTPRKNAYTPGVTPPQNPQHGGHCGGCKAVFDSGNKLYKHLRATGHGRRQYDGRC